jgi:hypothetical protein
MTALILKPQHTILLKKIALFVVLFINIDILSAQNFPNGARQAGLSNASVTLTDVWASQTNQAGLAKLKSISIGAYYGRLFNISELSVRTLALALPAFRGTAGLSYTNFGFSAFNQSKIGLSYALPLGNIFQAAIQVDYFQLQFESPYEKQHIFTGEIGLLSQPTDKLSLGFHLFNPKFSKKEDFQTEMSTVLKFGGSYKFGDFLLLCAETEKEFTGKPQFKTGLEYNYRNYVFLRAGISNKPENYSFGLGTKYKKMNFDIAFCKHPTLNNSSHFSIQYSF